MLIVDALNVEENQNHVKQQKNKEKVQQFSFLNSSKGKKQRKTNKTSEPKKYIYDNTGRSPPIAPSAPGSRRLLASAVVYPPARCIRRNCPSNLGNPQKERNAILYTLI